MMQQLFFVTCLGLLALSCGGSEKEQNPTTFPPQGNYYLLQDDPMIFSPCQPPRMTTLAQDYGPCNRFSVLRNISQ